VRFTEAILDISELRLEKSCDRGYGGSQKLLVSFLSKHVLGYHMAG